MLDKNQRVIKKLLEKKFDIKLRDSAPVIKVCDDIIECIVDWNAFEFFKQQSDLIEMAFQKEELENEKYNC